MAYKNLTIVPSRPKVIVQHTTDKKFNFATQMLLIGVLLWWPVPKIAYST